MYCVMVYYNDLMYHDKEEFVGKTLRVNYLTDNHAHIFDSANQPACFFKTRFVFFETFKQAEYYLYLG